MTFEELPDNDLRCSVCNEKLDGRKSLLLSVWGFRDVDGTEVMVGPCMEDDEPFEPGDAPLGQTVHMDCLAAWGAGYELEITRMIREAGA